LFYKIDSKFIFKDNVFQPLIKHIEIPNYPDEIKGVLLQYISLCSLDFGEITELNSRLKNLCIDEISNLEWDKNVWADGYRNTYFKFNGQIKFDIGEKTENATASAVFFDEVNKKHNIFFELKKSNEKWQITKIELL
jgi:hypothetical protein